MPTTTMLIRLGTLLLTCLIFSSSVSSQSLHNHRIDPLLKSLSDNDLLIAEAQARKHFSQSWNTVTERSRFVRYRLIAKLNELNAPVSLQVLPVIESTYNPYALSHAGALGLWQLMPKTAKWLGLHSNHKLNGRRDIDRSSTVAIQYLQQLHDRFDNWPLALAAYNMGPNGLSRQLRKNPWNIADGLEKMPIPSATRAYVQQAIGLASLLNKGMVAFPDPIKTRMIQLQPPVDIRALETLSGMEKDDIFRFNPCLNQAQYFSHPVTIHVPESNFNNVHSNIKHAGPKFVHTRVQKGDSLWSIAKAHGTTVQMLKQLNRKLGKYLRAGQRLKVPANQLAKASANENPLLPGSHRIRYKVRSGDSLWRIAKRFGTTVKAIARVNSLSLKRKIRAGDTLWVLARRVESS
ncbi:membrane-bound lytic murein transglycosylase D [Mariprofundus micogutta]|uniref:Membrane-bound lytic murein transglycosylase D n=1 Tax=Mariprofundus micogutta TaxID=1921010 RepID=A0A1L8CLS6_9PROT|nr:LysM peptidoglycan-binding domain-containing protein [Mariprofundus micogutta]GAV19856.1 membrane-bound lytic murein transglycosylase D [Mariprofundus micogutta]